MFVDVRVERLLRDWKKSAFGYTPSEWTKQGRKLCKRGMFGYDFDGETLTVYSDYPGFLIGFKGERINEYTEAIKAQSPKIKAVKIKEIHVPRGL